MSSLWDRTQKLPKEYFKQVEQVYGEHFPLEVGFIYLFCFFLFFLFLNSLYFAGFVRCPKHDPDPIFHMNFCCEKFALKSKNMFRI
jgi:hypothetical protein